MTRVCRVMDSVTTERDRGFSGRPTVEGKTAGLSCGRKMCCEFGASRDAHSFCEALQIIGLRSECIARDNHFPSMAIDH